jgi:hypothetical protein
MGKVIPFRRRPPSQGELEAYRWITRRWSPALKDLMVPQYSPGNLQPARVKSREPKSR